MCIPQYAVTEFSLLAFAFFPMCLRTFIWKGGICAGSLIVEMLLFLSAALNPP